MSKRGDKLARGIRSFIEHPVTNLVKGVALLLVGFSDASHTLQDDLTHGHARLGHGLIIIGLFNILGVLPQFIEGLGAWARYHELQEKQVSAKQEPESV